MEWSSKSPTCSVGLGGGPTGRPCCFLSFRHVELSVMCRLEVVVPRARPPNDPRQVGCVPPRLAV
eukprot:6461240-Amphidinium_carterae.1